MQKWLRGQHRKVRTGIHRWVKSNWSKSRNPKRIRATTLMKPHWQNSRTASGSMGCCNPYRASTSERHA